VADDLSVLRQIGRGYLATALVRWRDQLSAATRYVDRALAARPQYPELVRRRMEQVLGGERGLDLERLALEYCRRTLEERWGHWRALHRAGWNVETEVEGIEQLEAARAAGRGAILWGMSFCGYLTSKIALHRAGARVVMLSAADHGAHYPPTRLGLLVVGPLYCRAENRYLAERVTIPHDRALGYLHTIKARLEANRNVYIAGERVAPRRNVSVRLLGRDLQLATGAPSLSFAVGSRLLPVDVVRTGPFRYRLRIDAPIAPSAAPKRDFVETAVTEFAARLERRILEHPADWMWEHHVASRIPPAASD
jgi:hypothetical protein